MRILKNGLWVAVLLVMGFGCKKDPGTVSFDVSSQAEFVVEGSGSILSLIEVVTPGVSTNWSGEFANHNTNKEKLRDMRLKSLVLNITQPAGETFEYLENIHIFIEAEGLQETEIAWRDNIPTNIGQTLELNTKDVDISPYAKKDAFKLRVKAKQRSLNSDDVTMRADMVFRVTADVLD